MNKKLQSQLIELAQQHIISDDPSHDILHAKRVMNTAEYICNEERGDLDVVIPAALFHDVITYPKDSPQSKFATEESAKFTVKLLDQFPEFTDEVKESVFAAIRDCSFSKGVEHTDLNAKIVQDADGLEATGAISVMRTYVTAGQMNSTLYHPQDPFLETERDVDSFTYALDLFYKRLLKVEERMYTETAKKIARRRTAFLESFLDELRIELNETKK